MGDIGQKKSNIQLMLLRSFSRVGSVPAGDVLASGYPGCELKPVDIIGVNRCAVRDVKAVF